MIVRMKAKGRIAPVLLDRGDILEFTRRNGQTCTLELLATEASVMRTNLGDFSKENGMGGTLCQFNCTVRIDGHEMTLQRYLPSQESFSEPYIINGMRVWLDAVQEYFQPFTLRHGPCRPPTHARFAVGDATDPVGPDLGSWYPNERGYIDVADCYLGDDVWMGPYHGGAPHAGLDVNMPKGTPLYAPMDLDDQWLHTGFAPKPGHWAARWAATRRWPDGSTWTLQVAHLNSYLVPEHTPVRRGTQVAEAAGTGVGWRPHSHFAFVVRGPDAGCPVSLAEVEGRIISETEDGFTVDVGGKTGQISKAFLLYRKHEDDESSIFLMPETQAIERGFAHEAPGVPLDPWYLFWQIFEDDRARRGLVRAYFAPVGPARAGEPVSFDSQGSRPGPGASGLAYYWAFGDGGWSSEPTPSHTFATPGVYPVSLVVDDGQHRHRHTQHITVAGSPVRQPSLSLAGPREISFHERAARVADAYGCQVPHIPHTLYFVARETRPVPESKEVWLTNEGHGELATAEAAIAFQGAGGWARVVPERTAQGQRLLVSVDATGLVPGTYAATVSVACRGALNSPQGFRVLLEVRSARAQSHPIVDDGDPEFFATPFFWIGTWFQRWDPGYKHHLLTNGGRAREGEYVRFTPDLEAGRYTIGFVPETPFSKEARFKVWVHHAGGDTYAWVEPARSLQIGEFLFAEGTDGFVQVVAEGSTGEILADAIQFYRIA